jgi:SAM-dependent methyltransferase
MNFLSISLLLLSAAIVFLAALFLIIEFYAVIIGMIKGAPFIRSSRKKIKTMLELADIKSEDKTLDLGSGDGTLLFEAARLGAMAEGVEINPLLVMYSRWRAKRLGFKEKITIHRKSIFDFPLHNADVVFLYLWPKTNEILKDKLARELKVGAKIISSSFIIPGWKPVKEKGGVFLYIIQ